MMRRFGLPVLPLIIGVILGPRAEGQLRKTLQLSAGDVSGLWSEPIAVGIYVIVAIILIWPLLMRLWRKAGPQAVPAFGGMHAMTEGTDAEVMETQGTDAETPRAGSAPRQADSNNDYLAGSSQHASTRRQEKP